MSGSAGEEDGFGCLGACLLGAPAALTGAAVVQGFVYVVDCEGRTLEGWPLQMGEVQAQVAVGDINGDGALEVVAVDMRGNVAALAPDGTELWERHIRSAISQVGSGRLRPCTLALIGPSPLPVTPKEHAGCTGIGRMYEVVTMHGFTQGRNLLPCCWRPEQGGMPILALFCQVPVFGDVNGDGVLEVVLGSSSGVLVVLSGISGRDVAPFPFRTHGSLHSQVTATSPAPPAQQRSLLLTMARYLG